MSSSLSIDQWMNYQDCLSKLLCAQFESNLAYE